MLPEFTKGIIRENPLFVQLLGVCPALATTSSLTNALGMGAAFTAVLIGSNLIISALKKFIPANIRIPAYIVVIASLVTVTEMLMNAYVPAIYESLGIFIPLIVVNCIILGRAEAFASKNGLWLSFQDAVGMGMVYLPPGFDIVECPKQQPHGQKGAGRQDQQQYGLRSRQCYGMSEQGTGSEKFTAGADSAG